MSTLERAIVIAATAHAGQTDKAGAPYILHPLRVMLGVSGDSERIVAVLHDVVEDTPVTPDALREFGFTKEILHAICLITKVEGEAYSEFVARAASDDVARHVKFADIVDNMDLSRIAAPTERDTARLTRYRRARKYIEAVGRARGERGLMAPTILPLENDVTSTSVEEACPVVATRIYACDFYVAGIEDDGNPFSGGYRRGRIFNIDHHAPMPDMERHVTSTMLALEAIRTGVVTDEPAYTAINHTDCDSMLSSALVMGLTPSSCACFPDVHTAFADACANADHTGLADPIADLLQGLDEQRHGNRTDRQYIESLRNLLLLLDGKPLEPVGDLAVRDRAGERAQAEELVRTGRVIQDGPVAYGELPEEIDGALFLPFLPDARVIMLVSRHPADSGKYVVKLRLGKAAPAGFTLHSLGIRTFDSAFGGRWNAGSNKRGGGTALSPSDYLRELKARIVGHDDGEHRVPRRYVRRKSTRGNPPLSTHNGSYIL